jgi:hypothetical protein
MFFEDPYSKKISYINTDSINTDSINYGNYIEKHEETHIVNKYFLKEYLYKWIKKDFIKTYQEEILAFLNEWTRTIHDLDKILDSIIYNKISPYLAKRTNNKGNIDKMEKFYYSKLEEYIRIAYVIKQKHPDNWLYKLRIVEIHHWERLLW